MPVRSVTPAGLAADVRKALRAEADPAAAAGAQRFFKEPVRAYGVYTPFVKEVVREIWPIVKPWSWEDRFDFCNRLWRSGMLEEGILVTHLCRKWARQTGLEQLAVCGVWLEHSVTNWAQCDNLCLHWIAVALQKDPALVGVMDGWERSPVKWKRRASLAGLVHEARRGRALKRARRLTKLLKDDPEEIVRKAVVWLERCSARVQA
jgi:3-methyladenine DNA glycosylase AlkD